VRLTEKDREFLLKLKQLLEDRVMEVEFKPGRPSSMVLLGTYGEHIQRAFGMTRQGVRWRFQRVFNDVYVSAFSTILFIEKTFGTRLRDHAMRISRERYTLLQERGGFVSADELLPEPRAERRDPAEPDRPAP